MNESESEIENNKIDEITSKIKMVHKRWGNRIVIELFEKNILKVKNPELSIWIAKNIKGADIKSHAQIVLESKNPEWNYYYAYWVKGADKKAHAQVVLESKNPYWNYRYAYCIKGANINMFNGLMSEKNIQYFEDIDKKILSLSPSDK